jgi:Activator of Hsp90 ATPase homolog 1-like protein
MGQNLHFQFTVDQPANEVFDAVNNVTQWWTKNVEGQSKALNDEFSVQFADVHYSKQKLIELVPDKKVVWLVSESQLNFLENKEEWNDTRVTFEVTTMGKKTKLDFTHVGLTPGSECYNDVSGAWKYYVCSSLYELITSGKGTPETK